MSGSELQYRMLDGLSSYQFREDGEVVTLHPNAGHAPRILTGGADKDGYRRFTLIDDAGKRRSVRRAVMICRAFHGEPPVGQRVRHLNGNNTDDAAMNVTWGTQKQNIADKEAHGTKLVGEHHPNAKLTEGQVIDIRSRASAVGLPLEFGVSRGVVYAIRAGRLWKHLLDRK